MPVTSALFCRSFFVLLFLLNGTVRVGGIDSSKHTVHGSRGNDISHDQNALYLDVTAADTTESLERISKVPLKYYEFKYDSVPGRRQLGVLGNDVRRYFPEAVEVIANYPIPNKDRTKPPTILNNFPLVDKQVLFMHGLAALQELFNQFHSMQTSISHFNSTSDKYDSLIATLEKKLEREADQQLKEKLIIAELEADVAKKNILLEDLRKEEEKKAIDAFLEQEKELLAYEQTLVRKRMERQEQLARESVEKSLLLEKELAEKREALSRETESAAATARLQYDKELEQKKAELEKEKIRAEITAKAEQERANEEMTIRKMQAQARMDRERMKETIKSVSNQIVSLLSSLLSQPQRLAFVLAFILLVYTTFYLIRETISVTRSFIQSKIGKPTLVRETSFQLSILPRFLTPSYWGFGRESLSAGLKVIEAYFKEVILSDEDKDRVIKLALATRNTKSSGAPYRHVLFHGPPGTGKTMIARRLAAASGMDYAIMSGGDVGPLGEDAVNQLHHLFRWAARSRRGLLLFIDEAEAFLSSRGSAGAAGGDGDAMMGGGGKGTDNSSIHSRLALNALLYQTGTQSTNFMLVLATNRPEDLDSAILDRVDVSLKIGLPGQQERVQLLKLYAKEHLFDIVEKTTKKANNWLSFAKKNKLHIQENCFNDGVYSQMAIQCQNFSGREISKLFIATQYAMYLADKQTLTRELLELTLVAKVDEHNQKIGFLSKKNASGNANGTNGMTTCDSFEDEDNATSVTAKKSGRKR